MHDNYRMLFDLLTQRERRRFFVLLGFIIIMGLVDMAGVASILPFLAVVSDPGMIHRNAHLAQTYDFLGIQSDRSFLVLLGLGVLGLLILSLIVKSVTLIAMSRFTQMRIYNIAGRILAGYLRQPYAWFMNIHSSQLGRTILNDVNVTVANSMLSAMRIIAQVVTVVCLMVLLFLVNPRVSVAVIVMCLGSYLLIFFGFRKKLGRLSKIVHSANREKFKQVTETFGAIKDIKLLGLESVYQKRFQVPGQAAARSTSSMQVIGEMPRYVLETIAFGSILLLILGLLVTGDGSITSILPTLGIFAFAGIRIFPAAQLLYYSMSNLRASSQTLYSVHKEYMEVVKGKGPKSPDRSVPPVHLQNLLELKDIRYAYPAAERATLNRLSLSISANTTVGIVGGTGAGKTTTVDVILGLLEPQGGEILIDGTPVTSENRRGWQSVLGYVPQQIFLVDDSVSANIAFGEDPSEWDPAAIEQAARIANLHDFIMSDLPQGYDTHVGERGVRLSGGQRQRIGIARALYRNPDVLILDEATSALDNLTERAVMEAVHNLRHAKTIIMIAHRLTTVKDCDVIFLLEQGRLVAQGTYDELCAGNETFRRMVGT